MLRVALPNKGTLAEPAATMMREAGYRQRSDARDLSMMDEENEIEFFYLRPKDIATYVGSGDLHLGRHRCRPHGRVRQPGEAGHRARLRASKFRFAAPTTRTGSSRTSTARRSPRRTRGWSAPTWPATGSAPTSSSWTARSRSRSSSGSPTRSPTSCPPGARCASTA